MTAKVRRFFTAPDDARGIFARAAALQKDHKDQGHNIAAEKSAGLLAYSLSDFRRQVLEKALPSKEKDHGRLKDYADAGRGPKAVWDLVAHNHLSQSFYIPSLPLDIENNVSRVELGREVADALVKELKVQYPAFWEGLQTLFDYCEKNDMAIAFSYPQKTDAVPEEYKALVPERLQDEDIFWKMDITVSPLDPHYRPLTVGRLKMPEVPGLELRQPQPEEAWFSNEMCANLQSDTVFGRFLAVRRYDL
ncbi:MAG: hypothetical protein H6867_06105 [Rhodospirillales bacterium]|nr:hypothetical protein [Rhodospirillales bacterium]